MVINLKHYIHFLLKIKTSKIDKKIYTNIYLHLFWIENFYDHRIVGYQNRA